MGDINEYDELDGQIPLWDDGENVAKQAEKRARIKDALLHGEFGVEPPPGVNPKDPTWSDQFETNEPGIIEEGDWNWILEFFLPEDWDETQRDDFFNDVVDYVYTKYDDVFAMAHREPLIGDDGVASNPR